MVQLSTPGVTPNRGMGHPVRHILSNCFDLLLHCLFHAIFLQNLTNLVSGVRKLSIGRNIRILVASTNINLIFF